MNYKILFAAAAASVLLLGGSTLAQEKKQLAFVVNASSDFWKLAEAGVKKAQAELGDGYELAVPLSGAGHRGAAERADGRSGGRRHRRDHDLVGRSKELDRRIQQGGGAGAAFHHRLRRAAVQAHRLSRLVQHAAGVQAGEEMVKAMAGKEGKCMGFVGFLGADNAVERITGFKQAIEGKGIELVDVRGDDVDFTNARTNVDDVLVANPEINCMVGFYSYNPPKIYEALQAAGKLGQITVVAFDEDPVTLGAVKEGNFASTVVQQPFEWGYQGMKLMAAYLGGDKSMVPADGLIIVPTAVINKENVDAFSADLKAKIGG